MHKNVQNSLREVVDLVIQNTLLLSLEEKKEFTNLTPTLSIRELRELLKLLIKSNKNTDNILKSLEKKHPQVVKELDKYHKEILSSLFKEERSLIVK